MMGNSIPPLHHFAIIAGLILAGAILSFPSLLPDEQKKQTAGTKLFVRPDPFLLKLGLIACCCMICEGTMFDWSGIYFQKVVHAQKSYVGTGYTAFMCTMAAGRFFADGVIHRIGFKKTVRLSGFLIATGLAIAVVFPVLPAAIAGFFVVGLGVSSVVPLVYSEAGRSGTMAPGLALAAVSSVGFPGFVAGPPLIGLIAGMSSLRVSFTLIGIIGLAVSFLAGRTGKS